MHQNWPYHPHAQEEKIKPREIVKVEIEIWATGKVFEQGESLEVSVSGSYPSIANFGTNEHSLNAGQHTVHFDGDHQTYVSLPIASL
jgi:predicted acyl esterase